jgi:Domain of unknown function (DUF4440)
MVKRLGAAGLAVVAIFAAVAVQAAPDLPVGISGGLSAIRAAALAKSKDADAVFAADLKLVSQSGKVYARSDALSDLRGGFATWENRDVAAQLTGGTAVVTLINRRQRIGMDAAEFRIMQVWRKAGSGWQLAAQSSTPLTVSATATSSDITPQAIIERAYAAAGGDTYRYPGTLMIAGSMIDYKPATPVTFKPYSMHRVQPRDHPRGRVIDGKIRISAYRGGKPAMQIAFDGKTTYNMDGPTTDGPDAPFWRTTMGFGMIRFALNPGYKVERLADDRVDNAPTYTVRVTDAADESAVFSVRIDNARLVRVVFPTPRGVHERIFSDFFTKPGISWVQPGRVRSYINGIKETEFFYTDFEVGKAYPDTMFVIAKGEFPK